MGEWTSRSPPGQKSDIIVASMASSNQNWHEKDVPVTPCFQWEIGSTSPAWTALTFLRQTTGMVRTLIGENRFCLGRGSEKLFLFPDLCASVSPGPETAVCGESQEKG